MEKDRLQFSLWYFAGALLVVFAIQALLGAGYTETLAYSDFKILLNAGKIDNLIVNDTEVRGTIKSDGLEELLAKDIVSDLQKMGHGDHRFVTVRVNDPELVKDLEAAKVHFSGQFESHWFANILSWVLPALIFVGIWSYALKRMGSSSGVLEVGKSKAKVYMEKETGVTFDDVAGIDEAK
jgi:cell division protease FtsH